MSEDDEEVHAIDLSDPQQAYDWQEARRRDDGQFDLPVTGFASAGKMTLWLPSPAIDSKIVVKDGRASRVTVESCMTRPEIAALRDAVFKSAARDTVNGAITIDMRFCDYVIGVIGINYRCTDDELTELLAGTKWHQGMYHHLANGEDMIEAMLRISPSFVEAMFPAAPPPSANLPPAPEGPVADAATAASAGVSSKIKNFFRKR